MVLLPMDAFQIFPGVFKPVRKASPLQLLQVVDPLREYPMQLVGIGDYVQVRGVLTFEEAKEQIQSYFKVISEGRRRLLDIVLKEGRALAIKNKVDLFTGMGIALATYRKATDYECCLGQDLFVAVKLVVENIRGNVKKSGPPSHFIPGEQLSEEQIQSLPFAKGSELAGVVNYVRLRGVITFEQATEQLKKYVVAHPERKNIIVMIMTQGVHYAKEHKLLNEYGMAGYSLAHASETNRDEKMIGTDLFVAAQR